MNPDDIKVAVKEFILETFLPGEDPDTLDDSTPLITGGILDSLATLRLVSFLEDKYGVQLAPHELDTEHMDSVSQISNLVLSKMP